MVHPAQRELILCVEATESWINEHEVFLESGEGERVGLPIRLISSNEIELEANQGAIQLKENGDLLYEIRSHPVVQLKILSYLTPQVRIEPNASILVVVCRIGPERSSVPPFSKDKLSRILNDSALLKSYSSLAGFGSSMRLRVIWRRRPSRCWAAGERLRRAEPNLRLSIEKRVSICQR